MTRSNPRLGQSSSALTSLGAVGGARGTAAGALRVIVEFLTQYDPKAIKTLESDLTGLNQLEQQLGNQQISLAARVSQQRLKIQQAEALQNAKFTDREAKAALKKSEALRLTGRPSDLREAQEELKFAIKKQGLSAAEERIVRNLIGARTRLVTLEARALQISQDRLGVEEQQNAVAAQLTTFQNLKQNLPSKLGGLALGAVGGLVGGAIIGVGFQAAQAVLDAIADGLKDIFDPAHRAREALDEVTAGIAQLKAADSTLTDEAAVLSFLRSVGQEGSPAVVKLLATASAAERAKVFIDEYMKSGLVAANADALYAEQVQRLTEQLLQEAKARAIANGDYGVDQVALRAAAEAEAIYRLGNAERIAAEEAERLAQKQERLQQALEATAALASIAARALSEAISSGADALTGPIDARIGALQEAGGESARTKAIQAKIDQLNNKGSGSSQRNTELANIAEERSLILLRMRLRALGTNINLEKFEGKFLLEAINAKIKALDKQAAAQDRVNKALDLQLRASQQLKRQQGETIGDFLERRAKENRDILSEQRALELENQKAALQDLQDKTQDEVALRDLAERKKNALVKSGSDNRIRNLQRELAASKKADADALKGKIAALQKEKDALKKGADNAEYYSTVTANEEIRQALRAANTVAKISAFSGTTRGLEAAKSFLKALLTAGVLQPGEAKQVQAAIDRINKTLSSIADKQYDIGSRTLPGAKGPTPFAAGGFIPLNGGSSPFGRNARFGEHGTEVGMQVLTTQALNKMRQSGKGGDPAIGSITINRSDDAQRDFYMTKRAVKEGMSEALG